MENKRFHHIKDISQLSEGYVSQIFVPNDINELQYIIENAQEKISIMGSNTTQGGHTWYNGGIIVDMKNINKIIDFDITNKTISVQSGITWAEVQKFIDDHNLSVRVMQSYNDFTVGGSLSVNIHSRSVIDGSIINTVKSIKVLLSNGKIIDSDREHNEEVFFAAIGGYGAIGIIIEATLSLTNNVPMKFKGERFNLEEYYTYFKENIRKDPQVVLHNANIDIVNFDNVFSLTWVETNEPCTIKQRMRPKKGSPVEYFGFQIMRYIKPVNVSRLQMELKMNKNKILWRNYEMSKSIKSIEPMSRSITTTLLQEYFIPLNKLNDFLQELKNQKDEFKINILNASIRYLPIDCESLMAYAQQDEMFSIVLYINLLNNKTSKAKLKKWTRILIDKVLELNGTYYLPYQLYATKEQFYASYPNYNKLLEIKKRLDPDFKFMNTFLKKYIVN